MVEGSNPYAITSIDGRYYKDTKCLSEYMSEYGLMKQRYLIEIQYLQFMIEKLENQKIDLDKQFNEDDYLKIKEIESRINHDVKAVEYLIRKKIDSEYHHLIHFGLTSHDINNTSHIINLKLSLNKFVVPLMTSIVNRLTYMVNNWKDIKMLSFTHGQPATPTTVGNQLKVFSYRLLDQLCELSNYKFSCKFGGSVGTLDAHYAANNSIKWENLINEFVEKLGLERELHTTQISNYDNLSRLLSILQRINTIMIDMCQDLWLYTSRDYFKLKIIKDEVGSSTMPHKVNPIFFENAEGNLGLANAIIQHMVAKLPISRLQRDLTDSTVMRNLGLVLGYMVKSYKSIIQGLNRVDIHIDKIEEDLNNNVIVYSERIQTILRYNGYQDAYEKVKDFARNNLHKIDRITIHEFIETLEITDEIKEKLKRALH